MPRIRHKGSLERSAVADLFKHTLSQIPTLYGRLSYLASLRDPNSGVYRHYGLFLSYGREQSAEALRTAHTTVFNEWIVLSLEAKNDDLTAYLATLEDPQDAVVRHLRHSKIYRTLLPPNASPAEAELFSIDLDLLLEAWR